MESSAHQGAEADRQPARKLVLILDDDPLVAAFISEIITGDLHWDHVLFTDAHEALNFVRQKLPDLMVLDVRIPDVDGLQFYDRVRTDNSTGAIPVLFVSAIRDMAALQDFGVPNKIAFVSKPFDVDTFIAAVKTLIDT